MDGSLRGWGWKMGTPGGFDGGPMTVLQAASSPLSA